MKKLLVVLFIAVFCKLSFGQNDKLSLATNEHQKTVSSFKTISCGIVIKSFIPENKTIALGNYFKSGNLIAIHQGNETQGMDHFLVQGGETRGVGRSRWNAGEPTSFNAFRWPISQSIIPCDVLDEMLLNFPMPTGTKGNLPDLIQSLKTKPYCIEKIKNGTKCLELTVDFIRNDKRSVFKYWLDINRNYLVFERETRYDKPGDFVSSKIIEFSEPSKGIYFPTKEIRSFYNNGIKTQERTSDIYNLVLNQPIDPENLKLPEIPEGTILTDEIDGKRGYVDSSWKWIKKISQSSETKTTQSLNLSTTSNNHQSADEPWESGNVLLISGSLIFLVFGSIFMFYKYK